MKDIKEFLHLYLGQRVIFNDAKHENQIDTLAYMNNLGDCGGHEYEWQAKNCQPILKRLSDMSEDDAIDIYKSDFDGNNSKYGEQSNRYMKNYVYQNLKDYKVVALLLKKGYWLFGDEAFESGLIIDSKTLEK